MGRYASLVAAEGGEVVGVDVSEAVDAGAARYPNVAFVQADVAALPFLPRQFDLVYSFGVLHHLPDPIVGLKSAFDMVRPGGRLLVWVYSKHGGLLRRGRLAGRSLVRRMPALRRPLAALVATYLLALYVLPFRLTGRRPKRYSFFADKGYRELFVDCYDALSAPLEIYLDADDCRRWIDVLGQEEAGYERRHDGSGWLIWARRSPGGPPASGYVRSAT
jgi:SAM-dependent methyltransferase